MEKKQKNITIPRKLFVVIVLLLGVVLIWLIFSVFKEPQIIVEYRNQSCERNDWTGEYEPINNISTNWSFELNEEEFGYSKVPDNYILIEVYREVCNFNSCRYYKQNLYFKKGGLNSSQP
jgi:hypothetical protein